MAKAMENPIKTLVKLLNTKIGSNGISEKGLLNIPNISMQNLKELSLCDY